MKVVAASTLLAIVVLLGIQTATNPIPLWVAAFGLASAIIAPLGLSLVWSVVSWRQNEALRRLSVAGDLERRMAEAETYGEKVKALQKEEKRLALVVQFEARRMVLLDRRTALDNEVQELGERADEIYRELEAIENELRLLDEAVDTSTVRADVRRIQEELRRLRSGERHPVVRVLDNIPLSPMLPWVPASEALKPLINWLDGFIRARRLQRLKAARRSTGDRDDVGATGNSSPNQEDHT